MVCWCDAGVLRWSCYQQHGVPYQWFKKTNPDGLHYFSTLSVCYGIKKIKNRSLLLEFWRNCNLNMLKNHSITFFTAKSWCIILISFGSDLRLAFQQVIYKVKTFVKTPKKSTWCTSRFCEHKPPWMLAVSLKCQGSFAVYETYIFQTSSWLDSTYVEHQHKLHFSS